MLDSRNHFKKRRDQVDYANLQDLKLPIGSGVVEAACKTLVTQRLKRSGMSWSLAGGQGILTLRAMVLSGRWSSAWKVLSDSYRAEVYRVRTRGHLRCAESLDPAV